MATIFEDNTEEQDEQQPGSQAPTTPTSPGTGPSAPAGGSIQAAPMRQGSSSRPNIQQYLKANVGAGQQIASGIQKQATRQAGELGRRVGETSQALQAGSRPLEQELGEEGQQRIQTAFRDPSNILQNQQQLQQFQRLRDVGAQQDIQAYGQGAQQSIGQLNPALQQLQQQAQGAGTEMGRFQLLKGAFGQPTYSRGQQKLDQLLLQADKSDAARNLQKSLGGIAQQAQQGVTGLQTEAQARQAALQGLSQQRAEQIKSLFTGGAEAGLESDIGQRGLSDIEASSQAKLQQAQAAVEQVPGLRDRLAKNQLTESDIQALGLQAGQKLYNVDLGTYINQSNLQPTLAGAADPTEFARYQALRQLAGQEGDIFGGATSAGEFKPYQFDAARLQEDLGSREAKAQEYFTSATNALKGLNQPADFGAWYNYQVNPMYVAIQEYTKNPTLENLQKVMGVQGATSGVNVGGAVPSGVGNVMQDLAYSPFQTAAVKQNAQRLLQIFPELRGLDPERVLRATSPEEESNVFGDTFNVT